METHLAYCSALDREVRVYLRPVYHDETDPAVTQSPGVICIDHAEDCLGICCPLFDVPVDSSLQRYDWFSRR
jgi:hypothetical protein